jgi:diaminohydroxyphosphoribosylaminopyrimidine deaminase/5-amino-6-(5-phosphoribosylamino)uracil reductase
MQELSDRARFSEERVRGKLARTDHPYVTLKAAITLDGKIATAGGASQWITGEAAREMAHRLRARHDGVLVGINTVTADDPRLTVRLPGSQELPARIVLDSRCAILPSARCLTADGAPRIVITGAHAPPERVARLRELGVRVLACDGERPAPEAFLPLLRAEGLESLLVEGGGQVHANMIAHGVADELVLFIAGKIAGHDAPGWCAALGVHRLEDLPRLELQSAEPVGEDLVLRAWFAGGTDE